MRKPILIGTLIVLILLSVASGAIGWLCYTAAGLRFALMQLNHVPGLVVTVAGVQGKLAGPLIIQHITIDHEQALIDLEAVEIELTPAALLSGLIKINRLTTSSVKVQVRPRDKKQPDHPIYFLPRFLRISVDQVAIQQATYQQDNKLIIDDAHVQGQVALSRSKLSVNDLVLLADSLDLRGAVLLKAGPTLTLSTKLQANCPLPKEQALRADIEASGSVTGLNPQISINAQLQQPQQVAINSVLKWTDHQWNLQGDLAAKAIRFDPWWPQPAFSLRNVGVQFSLSDTGMRYVGQWVIPELSSVPLNIDVQSDYADHVLTVQSAKLSMTGSPTQLATHGTIAFKNESKPEIDLQTQWSNLQWPLRTAIPKSKVISTKGMFNLSGSEPYQYELAGQLSAPYWTEGVFSIKGEITPEMLKVNRYEASSMYGQILGTASLKFGAAHEWHLVASGSNLDPSAIDTDWPGNINLKAMAEGKGFSRQSQIDVRVSQLNGKLKNQAIQGSGRISHVFDQWTAEDIDFNWGGARLTAEGSTGTNHDLRWALDVPQLKLLDDRLSGDISMKGSLRGSVDEPKLSLQMQTKRLGYQALQLQGVNIATSLDMTDQSDSTFQISADKIGAQQVSLTRVRLKGEGKTAQHNLTLQGVIEVPAFSESMPLDMGLQGGYSGSVWQGVLNNLRIGQAQLKQQSQLMLSMHQAQLSRFCLEAIGGGLCADGHWQRDELGRNEWHANAQVESLPITIQNKSLINGAHLQAKLDGQLAFMALPNLPWHGTADIQMKQAGIHYRAVTGRDEVLPIKLGELHLQADDQVIQGNGELRISEQTVSTVNASLNRKSGLKFSEFPLSGVMTLSSSDAKLIPVFVPEVDRANGTLAAAIQLSGNVAAPRFEGIMRLLQGELDFYRLNLALRDINFDAQINTDQLQFTAQANAGLGLMNSTGQVQWGSAAPSGQLQLKGERLLVADLPEYRVFASPDLQFVFKDNNVNVTGSVLIPEARLQPKVIKGAVQVSTDARYKDEPLIERKQTGWTVDSQTKIRLGDKVSIDALGLTGRLTGEVMTRLRTNEKAVGSGELNINEGSYELYGQKLNIKRGQLLYDNTLLSDPGLNIQAERDIDTRTVGVNVRGLLREPRFQFYSTPAMSQTQALSYLLVGKPIDELQSTEAAKVGSASNTLAVQGGGFLASQVGRRIGIEQVDVQTDVNNQSSLVLGKFLSPRLFVSYGISLTQAINTLKLRYSLGEHWSLKSELGATKGADLEYKIDR